MYLAGAINHWLTTESCGDVKQFLSRLQTFTIQLFRRAVIYLRDGRFYYKISLSKKKTKNFKFMNKEQRDILNLLASKSMNERDMIDVLGRSAVELFFDLDELNSLGLVKTRHLFAGLDTWTITPEGRRYLK
jgi:hypothetical protein